MSSPASDEGPAHGALTWAVRSSFREYVASLPDGAEQVSAGAVVADDGRIVFPPRQEVSSSVYAFRGTLTFAGHAGLLRVELRDPEVDVASRRGTVSVAPGPGRTGERLVIAAFADWEVVVRRLIVPEPRLTWSGVTMLGDVYEVGDLLDPIEIDQA